MEILPHDFSEGFEFPNLITLRKSNNTFLIYLKISENTKINLHGKGQANKSSFLLSFR
jgi:hypothetical protein